MMYFLFIIYFKVVVVFVFRSKEQMPLIKAESTVG
jgi:hypothetical protein